MEEAAAVAEAEAAETKDGVEVQVVVAPASELEDPEVPQVCV